MTRSRLLPNVRAAIVLLVAALAVFVVLAVLVHGKADNRVDRALRVRVQDYVPARVIDALLRLTEPVLVVVLVLLLLGWALVRRWWRAAVLVIVVPLGCVLLTEHVFKPWIHRTDTGYLAFPSGHETGVASFACAAAVVLLASGAGVARKVIGLAALAAHVGLAAIALVGSAYHYATDTVGSLALCGTVTLVVAAALDAVGGRRDGLRPPRSRVPVAGSSSATTPSRSSRS